METAGHIVALRFALRLDQIDPQADPPVAPEVIVKNLRITQDFVILLPLKDSEDEREYLCVNWQFVEDSKEAVENVVGLFNHIPTFRALESQVFPGFGSHVGVTSPPISPPSLGANCRMVALVETELELPDLLDRTSFLDNPVVNPNGPNRTEWFVRFDYTGDLQGDFCQQGKDLLSRAFDADEELPKVPFKLLRATAQRLV